MNICLFVHVGFHVELLRRLVVLQRDEVLPQLVVVLVQLAGAVVNNLIEKRNKHFFWCPQCHRNSLRSFPAYI